MASDRRILETRGVTGDEDDPIPELTPEQVERLRRVPPVNQLEESDPVTSPHVLEDRAITEAVDESG